MNALISPASASLTRSDPRSLVTGYTIKRYEWDNDLQKSVEIGEDLSIDPSVVKWYTFIVGLLMQIFTTQQLEYSSNPKLETQTLLLLLSLSSLILIMPLHLILEIPQTSSPLNWIIYLFLNLWFFLLAGFNTSTIIPLLIGLLGIFTIVFKSYSELSGLISEVRPQRT